MPLVTVESEEEVLGGGVLTNPLPGRGEAVIVPGTLLFVAAAEEIDDIEGKRGELPEVAVASGSELAGAASVRMKEAVAGCPSAKGGIIATTRNPFGI